MVSIRQAQLEDIKELIELAGEMGYEITAQGIQPILEHYISNPDYYLLLALKDDIILGMVGFNIKYYLHREKPVTYIGSLVVKEDFRAQGIGKLLMHKVEEVARERKSNSIQLNSNKRRVRAHEFYKRLGFSEVSLKFEKILK